MTKEDRINQYKIALNHAVAGALFIDISMGEALEVMQEFIQDIRDELNRQAEEEDGV